MGNCAWCHKKTNLPAVFAAEAPLMEWMEKRIDAWCDKNNLSLLNFKKTIGNQREFCKFIEKKYKNKSMLNGIYESQDFLSKLKRKKEHHKFILSNLRMSICELG